jgi:signal transduction histidine kinase/PAS domain-containing protein
MHVDTEPDASRLRELLRDLVALSAIPAVWVERAATVRESGTDAVATGLADALVSLLGLEFAFLRLCDPLDGEAVDVSRGGAWKRFPEWLEGHRATGARLLRAEIVADVGDPEPCRGFAIPIGRNGDGGILAAASARSDFPTATDQLLLALTANQAATAFDSARLIHERRRAEEEVREAQTELEVKVAERTAELRRSEAYLAEAQRLTHTGSFAIDVATQVVTHTSAEQSRLYGFEPRRGVPSLDAFIERIHPQDRALWTEALELGIREGKAIEVEYRVVLPHSSVRRHRATAHPVFDASGELEEFIGSIVDVTEPRRAEAEMERLVSQQAALRRVATLVAREASRAEVFTAIAQEIGRLLGTDESRMLRYDDDHGAVVMARWGRFDDLMPIGSRVRLEDESATAHVFRTGRPARLDYRSASGAIVEQVRSAGVRCVVGTPIRVEGRLWGAMVTGTSQEEPLPPETESRLVQFTELMATAIANAESRTRADRLTEEQAALRRVATIVAEESSPAEVFAKVTEELANVLGDVDCSLFRDEGDGTATVVAVRGATLTAGVRVGTRWPLDGTGAIASALRHGRPCRIDDYSLATGTLAEDGRERLGIRSAVGCPILVRGRIWGALGAAGYEPEALPPDTEKHITEFGELVATAIANAEARAEVERLADEQAALRRVAMLVAEGASPTTVFDAVTAEMERLLNADGVTLGRYEPDDEVTVVAQRGAVAWKLPPGTRVKHEGANVTTKVRRSQQPARMEYYGQAQGPIAGFVEDLGVGAAVAAPIIVDGRLWGVTIANWRSEEPPPPGTEARMAQFGELLDTAIANADSRDQLMASRARLLVAGDEARRRVVHDLHDGAQQRLVHAVVLLKLARHALQTNDERAQSLVSEALEQAEQSNAELRELAHGILPSALTLGGLRGAVPAVVTRLDLPVGVEVPRDRLPPEIEASAYFIVAEALTNVAKHSQAARADVRVSVADGVVGVEVRDDGIGGADPGGHGLVGIGDRVTALGGRLTIESPVGGGTLLAATLPL